MKYFRLLTLVVISFVSAVNASQSERVYLPGFRFPEETLDDRKDFSYIEYGGTGLLVPFAPELSFGKRTLDEHHVVDLKWGITSIVYYYGQASYLYFPKVNSGFYSGIGLTGGVVPTFIRGGPLVYPHGNIPLTAGYQYEEGEKIQFLQFQLGPLSTLWFMEHWPWIPSVTVSYGSQY